MEPANGAVASLAVLVVDGHRDSADSLADLLTLVGHRVTVAYSCETALAAALADPPDVVLLEMWLHGLGGWQVAGQLRETGPRGKKPFIVAVTTRGSAGDYRRSAETGIDVHLVKPIDPRLLIRLLASVTRAPSPGVLLAPGPMKPEGDHCCRP